MTFSLVLVRAPYFCAGRVGTNAPRAIGVPMQDKNVSHDRLLLM